MKLKWIPVKDELPEEEEPVLVLLEGMFMDVGYMVADNWNAWNCDCRLRDVTHWTKWLPDLPEVVG